MKIQKDIFICLKMQKLTKEGDYSDFYYCQKCKKTIVVSMIDEVIKKNK